MGMKLRMAIQGGLARTKKHGAGWDVELAGP